MTVEMLDLRTGLRRLRSAPSPEAGGEAAALPRCSFPPSDLSPRDTGGSTRYRPCCPVRGSSPRLRVAGWANNDNPTRYSVRAEMSALAPAVDGDANARRAIIGAFLGISRAFHATASAAVRQQEPRPRILHSGGPNA